MPPLFTITTDRFHLTWSGPVVPTDPGAPPGYLSVRALRVDAALRIETLGEEVNTTSQLRLAEQTRYRVFARSRTGARIMLRHDDPLATQGLIGDEGGTILSGTVDFEGQVGRSRFVVVVGEEEEATFEVEVFPTKATFDDVETMRAELDEALTGLALEYLRSTTTQAQPSGELPRRATWRTLLRRTLPDLEVALEHIAAHPYHELNRIPHLVRAERVRRPDATLRGAVLRGRGAGALNRFASEVAIRTYVPERLAVATLDTPEHRWLRARLHAVRTTLLTLYQEEVKLSRSDRRLRTLADISDAERRLARLLRLPPLRAARVEAMISGATQRLLTAPAYAEAYHACRNLALGLELAGGPVPHATRDLHLLYELWCYLIVVRRTACFLDQNISEHDFFRAEHQGVRLMLRRGQRHSVTFDREEQRVQIAYNPRFAARPGLLAQRPDILITVENQGSIYRYVLDAKYRRDDATGYVRRYGAPGPPEDALGDLHRYRDAIIEADGTGVRRSVVQAVALYPYREPEPEAFSASRLWTSIATVGVGAIPLVPGATHYLDRWLADVLG